MNLETILDKFGAFGITLIILLVGIKWTVSFIKDLMRQHREERSEWSKRQEQQNEDHNRSLNKNTEVLSELTTLLKNRK